MIDMLSDEDRKYFEKRAICIYTFSTQAERDEFVSARYSAHDD